MSEHAPASDHEHYWIDAYDDETGWYCTRCGLTEYPGRDETDRPPVSGEGQPRYPDGCETDTEHYLHKQAGKPRPAQALHRWRRFTCTCGHLRPPDHSEARATPPSLDVRAVLDDVLSDPPSLEGQWSTNDRRWYMEGWHKLRRDILTRLTSKEERP